MPDLGERSDAFLRLVVGAASAIGVLLTLLGLLLTYTGATTDTSSELEFFGASIKSESAGLISVVVGAVLVGLLLKRALDSHDKAMATLEPGKMTPPEPPPKLAKDKYSITGHWEMRDWRHDYSDSEDRQRLVEEAKRKTFSNNAKLTQDADGNVSGFFENSVSRYKLTGVVKRDIFTGNWLEVNDEVKTVWYGAFQFKIARNRDGATMFGRWTGTSSDEERIHCGVWEWREKLDPTKPSRRPWPSEMVD